MTIPSLVKWSGSKRKQAPFLSQLAPKSSTYFEPFLGGGSMLYLSQARHQVVGDVYAPLVQIWNLVKENPHDLLSDYEQRWRDLQVELIELRSASSPGTPSLTTRRGQKRPSFYYGCRDHFNATGCPFAFNFLLRTCVNGIVRFNSKGEFNNSFHLSRDGMHPSRFKKSVLAWHRKLQDVDIYCVDYKELVSSATEGDFVYLDPPYLGCVNRYAQPIQKLEFFDTLERLTSKGVKWLLSLDGYSDSRDYSAEGIPESLYVFHQYLSNGRGLTNGVLNGKEGTIFESVYANYCPAYDHVNAAANQLSFTEKLKSA